MAYIFVSEVVCEAFGEIVIQGVLLSRFQWLIDTKDFSSFGLSFLVYVIISLGISFFSILPALLSYHNRGRESLREKFSFHTAALIICWIILLVTKAVIYVFGFLNNPGLFWIPMVVKMILLWVFFSCGRMKCMCVCGSEVNCQLSIKCGPFKAFGSLPFHDKIVYVLVSSLVPISIPSRQTKSMKGLYLFSIILYLLECLFVLLFAYVIRHFYSFGLYRHFYCNILPEKLHIGPFEDIVLYLVLAVLAATAIAALLITVSYNCCHPKITLFSASKKARAENYSEQLDKEHPEFTSFRLGNYIFNQDTSDAMI